MMSSDDWREHAAAILIGAIMLVIGSLVVGLCVRAFLWAAGLPF